MEPTFFAKPADFRTWLMKHHTHETELLVGFYKVGSGRESITWPQSVDEALCFGWIDGVRKSVDADSYTIRFTPRKKSSIWSAVNIAKMELLLAEEKVLPAGRMAFEQRIAGKSKVYSFEQEQVALAPAMETTFKKKHLKGYAFFMKQAPSYRKAAMWWVISAKQEATQLKRLEELMNDSEAERRLKHLISPVGKGAKAAGKNAQTR